MGQPTPDSRGTGRSSQDAGSDDLSEQQVLALADEIWVLTRSPYYLAQLATLELGQFLAPDLPAIKQQWEDLQSAQIAEYTRQAAVVAWAACVTPREPNAHVRWRRVVMVKAKIKPMGQRERDQYHREAREAGQLLAAFQAGEYADLAAALCRILMLTLSDHSVSPG